MRGNRNARALRPFQMIIQRVHTGDVVRVNMCKNDLAGSSFSNQIVDARGQGRLLIFIRRPGIDDQNFA